MKKYCKYYESPLGLIEIICTEKELISLVFTEEKNNNAEENTITNLVTKQLNEYFSKERKTFDLPIKIDGTDFQKKVWNEILKVPFGFTKTYKDIAIAIGNPNSSRAIGKASGGNKIWLIIPCHRIIGSIGKLTGYAGGIERKKWLLEHEKNNK